MDQRLVFEQSLVEVESRMLSEGIADGEHDFGMLEGFARAVMATVAEDAECQGMIFGNDALAV